MKKTISRTTLILMLFLIVFSFAILLGSGGFKGDAYAFAQSEQLNIQTICKEYTDSIYLYGEEKTESNKILHYMDYLNTRFDFNNSQNKNPNITDEWILKIVPTILFEEKVENFLYIGSKYGFYINYNANEDNYLVFLLKHDEDDLISGQYTRKIQPFYYERYKFNSVNKTASLIYRNYTLSQYYERYSEIKTLYIKDVEFTGKLYNENHLNDGEEGYNVNEDYGGYFFGNYYKFKGVSTQSGKLKFVAQVFKTLIGYVTLQGGLTVGDALNIADIATSLNETIIDAKNDFRGEISNESDYGYKFQEHDAQNQIEANHGHLSKAGGNILETDNEKNALLFGINKDSYIQNTFFMAYRNQDNKWNTRFAGKIAFDIVEEHKNISGSTVENITHAESLSYIKSFDNGEKTIMTENESKTLYALDDIKHIINFTAPLTGTFTIRTSGPMSAKILSDKGQVSEINNGYDQQLIVDLQENEILEFCVTRKTECNSNSFNVYIRFTPDEIKIGQTRQIKMQPGDIKYLEFNAEKNAMPFEYRIASNDNVMFQLAYNKYNNYLPNAITSNYLEGSSIAEYKGKYYFIISNLSEIEQMITIVLDDIMNVSQETQIEANIVDKKVYRFSTDFTSSIEVALNSAAPILMQIFDTNYNLLAWTSKTEDNLLLCSVEEGKQYYVVLRNLLYKSSHIDLSFGLRAYKLNNGENSIANDNKKLLMEFSTGNTAAKYQIQGNGLFTIYDDAWQVVNSYDLNKYYLESNKKYYLYPNVLITNINLAIINTSDKSGVFDDTGMVLIKYIPTRTTAYKVTGTETYEWYTDTLVKSSSYLYKGETYYLKLCGVPNSEYSVNILRNTYQIQPNSSVTIGEDAYFFNISQSGNYIVWITCPIGVSVVVNIKDSDGNILCENLPLVNDSHQFYFQEGLYYLNLDIVNGDKASIRINIIE